MKRRAFLVGLTVAPLAAVSFRALASAQAPTPRRGRIKQGVMPSVWQGLALPFEKQCQILADVGFQGCDLPALQPEQVPILRKYGLTPIMASGGGTTFANGLVRRELHDTFEPASRAAIDMCAAVGCSNLLLFPGERRGMSREEGAEHAVAMLNRVKGYAEQKRVTLCMEITNSKVVADQRTDQMFDHVGWGFDVCRRVSSPRVKILFDIYHAQISDGDVVRTIRDNFDLISHFHTAGVPGRNEIDDTQELNYRFIAQTIADLGYTGFISHEHRPGPGRDPIESLRKCFEVLTV